MKAVLLCAGYATRMGDLTASFPKALLPVAGRPILDDLADQLFAMERFDGIVVVTNHRDHAHFEAWAEARRAADDTETIQLIDDGTTTNDGRLGAIGDLVLAVDTFALEGPVVVVAGDNFFRLDWAAWLADLDRWADVVASNLAPGGTFYMAEFHPIVDLLSGYAYFGDQAPDVEEEGTYTDGGEDVKATFATWAHPLSRVLQALIGAGLELTRIQEYAFSPYDCFEGLVEREPGRFYRPHQGHDAPMVYTITARKPA